MQTALIFIIVFWSLTYAQQLICYDASITGLEEIDLDQLQPLVQKAQAMIEMEVSDLSISEATQNLPEILNDTFVILLQEEISEKGDDFDPSEVASATFEGASNTSQGVNLLSSLSEEPTNFVRVFQLFLSNFDLNCIGEPRLVLTAIGLQMISYFLQEPYQDSVIGILNSTAVIAAKTYGVDEQLIDVVEPVVSALESAQSSQGGLSSLLSLLTDDTISGALGAALDFAGFTSEPAALAAVATGFFVRLRDTLQIEDSEFVSFVKEILDNILTALRL